MDKYDKEAWREFISKPFDPSHDWRAIAAERRDAAEGETLPRVPGAEVIIVCPSCATQWKPEDERCPKCGRGMDEPIN